MNTSLRRRLLITLLSVTALIWLATLYTSYRDTRHEVAELFDAQMAQTARTLLSVAGHELMELNNSQLGSAHIHFSGETRYTVDGREYEHKLAYQLWKQPEGTLLLRSFSAPDAPLTNNKDGYSDEQVDGQPWRVFSLHDKASGFEVQVGEALEIRNEITDTVTQRIGLPLLIALPILAILIMLGTNRGLRPLKLLAETVSRRDLSNLDPINESQVPAEITPLVTALNRLFTRLSHAFESERRFTADAAHELRTPLASLKVQAQVAQRSHNPEEQQQALKMALKSADRASRLVEQLLTLARIDPESVQTLREEIRLDRLCEDAMAELEGEASNKAIELELNAAAAPRIMGMQASLAIMLRNLLDNAIRYTPHGGKVRLSINAPSNEGIELAIEDSGPGIPEQERQRIFDRFYRLAGQGTEGSGLGLSIVQRIAKLNQAQLELGESSLGGLAIMILFTAIHV
jgi:two-component system sensor histidine kinase QseC